MSRIANKKIWWVVSLAIFILIPQIFGIVQINTFVEFAIFGMYAVSVNLLLSYTGLLSFGHAFFFGTGAYATALALTHIEGFPLIPAILVGGLASALLALICCPLLVRVSGTAFAMLTLAFGQLMYVICLKFREVTGGEDGLAGFEIPPLRIPGLFSVDITNPLNFFYFAVAVMAICAGIMWFITKTPFGSIMVGIRDNAMRVDYMGFRLPHSKAVVFIISGTFAGMAGSMYALFQNVVSTDGVLHILVSFTPIMAILVGGLGTFFGPVIGQAALLLIEELSTRYVEHVELVSGLVFVFIVLFAPTGLIGVSKIVREKWFLRRKAV